MKNKAELESAIRKILPERIEWRNFLQTSDRCEGLGHNMCLDELKQKAKEKFDISI